MAIYDLITRQLFPLSITLFGLLCVNSSAMAQQNEAIASDDAIQSGIEQELPYLDRDSKNYKTPLAGEGFRTEFLGEEIIVEPRDRTSVNAWMLGLQYNTPGPDDRDILPIGSLYFWRQPEQSKLFYANIAGAYNDLFYGEQLPDWGDFQYALAFRNFTPPAAMSEVVDGRRVLDEEMYWGRLQWGIGLGYRTQVDPGYNDNIFMVNLYFEPGLLYFNQGSEAADNLLAPRDTIELGSRLEVKYDGLKRNILWLAHEGFAFGGNLAYGHRVNWRDWGLDGNQYLASDSRDHLRFDAYALGATGVPFIDSDRHRLIGSVHGGTGANLDRFSAQRIGGGVNPMGWDFTSTAMPVLPGASVWEYYPEHYLIGNAEYRWEPIFFSYLSLHGTAGWLNPVRNIGGEFKRKETFYSAVGGRLTTGFLGDTLLVVDVTHNFNVLRDDERGGSDITFFVMKEF